MHLKSCMIALVLLALSLGAGGCASTPESTVGGAPGSGAYTQGSLLGTDPTSVSVGGVGNPNNGNGGGSGVSVIGSH